MALTLVANIPLTWTSADAGRLLFCYEAGTSTKAVTYSDIGGTPNTNPIVLDANGRATIFVDAGSYKWVLAPPTDSDPPVSPIWTRDNVLSIPATNVNLDVVGTAGELVGAITFVYLSDGAGSRTAGRWYATDSDFSYASSEASVIGFTVSGAQTGSPMNITLLGRVAGSISGLVAGSVYYLSANGDLTATQTAANARAAVVADSSTSFIIPNDLFKVDDYKRSTAVGNGTTVETDIATYSVPGSTLFVDGQEFIFETGGHFAANANTKTIRMYFAGTVLHAFAAGTSGASWRAQIKVIRRGAATVVEHTSLVIGGAATFNTSTAVAVAFQNELIWDSHTPTLSAANIIKVTGQSSAATNDIVSDYARGYRPAG